MSDSIDDSNGPTKETSRYILNPYADNQSLVKIETLSGDIRGCRLALYREVQALLPALIRIREAARYFDEMETPKSLIDSALAVPPKGDHDASLN